MPAYTLTPAEVNLLVAALHGHRPFATEAAAVRVDKLVAKLTTPAAPKKKPVRVKTAPMSKTLANEVAVWDETAKKAATNPDRRAEITEKVHSAVALHRSPWSWTGSNNAREYRSREHGYMVRRLAEFHFIVIGLDGEPLDNPKAVKAEDRHSFRTWGEAIDRIAAELEGSAS